ncbi:MAG: class I adenylate-forming enzyme family protein [Geminicoccaceae bacterium]
MSLTNLAVLLDQHAIGRPSHPALIHETASLTYGELAKTVRRFADKLAADGVGKGDLVGVGLKDRPAHVMMLFAVMRLGAVIMPVDWRWTASETAALATDFALDALIVESDAPDVPGPRRIAFDPGWERAASRLAGDAPLVIDRDLPMILSLSSGTTGRPTGPLLTHGQMWARTENQLATLTFNQHDRYLLATPLYFGGGRAFALTHLMIGATLIMFPPPYTLEELVLAVSRHHATSTFLVPTLIRRLLDQPDEMLQDLEGLRLLISSGAPLHAEERAQIEKRLCPGFLEYFASTEGGGISIMTPVDRAGHPDSVGRAAFRVALQVVGDDHEPVAPGEAGVVRYRGPGVADGFFRNTEKSSEAFRDGWFYPGDLGRLDAAGYLTLLGRSKSLIIRGGVNIYPLEIERALQSHPDVMEVAVFGVADREMGEEICAAISAAPGTTEDILRVFCRERMAPYKVPRHIEFVEALPRNSGGKVLIDALRNAAELRLSGQ